MDGQRARESSRLGVSSAHAARLFVSIEIALAVSQSPCLTLACSRIHYYYNILFVICIIFFDVKYNLYIRIHTYASGRGIV
jgi:hypothetical protein